MPPPVLLSAYRMPASWRDDLWLYVVLGAAWLIMFVGIVLRVVEPSKPRPAAVGCCFSEVTR
jgi:hypothetical protein